MKSIYKHREKKKMSKENVKKSTHKALENLFDRFFFCWVYETLLFLLHFWIELPNKTEEGLMAF